jgi:uncharacterized protein (DUF302 family)
MAGFTLSTTCPLPFEQSVALAREALAEAGFGVLTEIDLRATFAAKLGEDIPDEVILGACNPRFAYAATKAEPSMAALLPCNVVARSLDDRSTVIEIFDPAAMARLGDGSVELGSIVEDVRRLLTGVLERIAERSRELEED